jgi:hypothetical protein
MLTFQRGRPERPRPHFVCSPERATNGPPPRYEPLEFHDVVTAPAVPALALETGGDLPPRTVASPEPIWALIPSDSPLRFHSRHWGPTPTSAGAGTAVERPPGASGALLP